MRALAFACLIALPAQAEVVITDAIGRQVVLGAPATRLVVNDSLTILSLALLDPDPVARIVGWGSGYRVDDGLRTAFRTRFPAIDAIPQIGGVTPRDVSIESLVAAEPDAFVVTLWDPGWDPVVAQLDAIGIPTVFLEDPRDHDATRATAAARSVGLLGALTGHADRAAEFSAFVEGKMAVISARLSPATTRPTVLVDAHAGLECCAVPGRDNMLAQMVAFVGGTSLGSAAIGGYDGRLSPEFVIDAAPQVYVATGGAHLAGRGMTLGAGIAPEEARASLASITADPIHAAVAASPNAVSHQLAISALHIVVTECLAKWVHPELFDDLDPEETLAEINRRFLAVPLSGSFCVSIR